MTIDQKANTRFAVVDVDILRAISQKSVDQVLAAQSKVDDEMLSALEGMIASARSNKLSGDSALALRAVAW